MSIGLTKTKADLDQRAGSIALDLRNVFDRIQKYQAALTTMTTGDLNALGYTSSPTDEVAQLKSAFTDFDQLRTIYEGTANLAVAKDFNTFGKLLTSVL